MDASISSVVSMGFGSWGSVNLMLTLGFALGASGPVVFQAVQANTSFIYETEFLNHSTPAAGFCASGVAQSESIVNTSTVG